MAYKVLLTEKRVLGTWCCAQYPQILSTQKNSRKVVGIRIPNLIVRELSLKDGSFVDIKNKEGGIIIKMKEKNKLAEILNKINEKNIHGEVETNGPIGNEIW